MTRTALLAVALASAPATAETGWLSTRGRVLPELRTEVFVGPNRAGAGAVVPLAADLPRAVAVEVAWAWYDRYAEAHVAHVWQLTQTRFATLSGAVAVNGFVVAAPGAGLGLGPHGTLSLALGGRHLTVELALDAGAEAFTLGPSRLPLRLALGLSGRISRVTVSVGGRVGADVTAGHAFVARADAVLSVGLLWRRP